MKCNRDCFNCIFKDCILTGNEILNSKLTHERILEYQRKNYKARNESKKRGAENGMLG